MKLDGIVPYHFQCAVCGRDCELQLPILHRNVTLPMPPTCPVPATASSAHILYALWGESPTRGRLTVRVDGSLSLVRGQTGETLAEVRVEGLIK